MCVGVATVNPATCNVSQFCILFIYNFLFETFYDSRTTLEPVIIVTGS